jgi:hypothetical protein
MVFLVLLLIFSKGVMSQYPVFSKEVMSQYSAYEDYLFFVKIDSNTFQNDYPEVYIYSVFEFFMCKKKSDNTEVGMSYSHGYLGFWNSYPDTFLISSDLAIIFINPHPNVVLKLYKGVQVGDGPVNNGIDGFIEVKHDKLVEKCVMTTNEGTTKLFFDEEGFVIGKQLIKDGEIIEEVFWGRY